MQCKLWRMKHQYLIGTYQPDMPNRSPSWGLQVLVRMCLLDRTSRGQGNLRRTGMCLPDTQNIGHCCWPLFLADNSLVSKTDSRTRLSGLSPEGTSPPCIKCMCQHWCRLWNYCRCQQDRPCKKPGSCYLDTCQKNRLCNSEARWLLGLADMYLLDTVDSRSR